MHVYKMRLKKWKNEASLVNYQLLGSYNYEKVTLETYCQLPLDNVKQELRGNYK